MSTRRLVRLGKPLSAWKPSARAKSLSFLLLKSRLVSACLLFYSVTLTMSTMPSPISSALFFSLTLFLPHLISNSVLIACSATVITSLLLSLLSATFSSRLSTSHLLSLRMSLPTYGLAISTLSSPTPSLSKPISLLLSPLSTLVFSLLHTFLFLSSRYILFFVFFVAFHVMCDLSWEFIFFFRLSCHQMFFTASMLHVHIMQWTDDYSVEKAFQRCDEIWQTISSDKVSYSTNNVCLLLLYLVS